MRRLPPVGSSSRGSRVRIIPGVFLFALWALAPIQVLAPARLMAQEGEQASRDNLAPRGIWLGWGLRNLNQADALVSPLRYGGTSWSASLALDLSTSLSLGRIELSYVGADLTSSISQENRHRQSGHWVDLRAGYFRRVARLGNEALSLHLGGELATLYGFYRHWYTEKESATWIHLFALLEPGGGWHLRLPDGSVVWQEVTVPLAGVVFRPPYQGLTEAPLLAWEGFGRVEGIRQTLHYRRSFDQGWKGGISYTFEGLRYPEPRPMAWVRHTLAFHLILRSRSS